MPNFTLTSTTADETHVFEILSCEAPPEAELVAELADELRDLYSDHEELAERLKAQAPELEGVIDAPSLESVVDRVLKASIPEPGKHQIPNLDVARNELGELLAHLVLKSRFGTLVPASRIRHKEIPAAPARGLDLLGLEFGPLVGVVSEVKTSSQTTSPPDVVGKNEDCLRNQYVAFLADDDRILAELNRLFKEADEAAKGEIARAIALSVAGKLDLVVHPVLVRPAEHAAETDFGCFQDEPEQFAGRRIRFSVVSIDQPIEDLAKAVYERARHA